MMDMTKGLTSTGNIIAETPEYLFRRLSQIFNFTVDVCALPENAKCERFYTPDDDGLSMPWGGEYGVILPMERISQPGCGRHGRSQGRTTTISSSCSFLHGPTPGGGGIGSRTKLPSSG